MLCVNIYLMMKLKLIDNDIKLEDILNTSDDSEIWIFH